ncbi:MAG: M20/M25/M40 family metallo-hydrolase [Anaerolineae bacterium]|nr:M20/M25/M40 family metallo-hydrolase [Thermoflexales bacterium]MDW8408729.1 M20/M25/M40 family metallo-hydrolase [Anaerolineae bacterium]
MIQSEELIQTLTNAVGLSGYESSIHELIKSIFQPLADEVRVSKVGSVMAWKRGVPAEGQPPKRLMLAAHIDEIGLIVSGIEKGFLRIARVGGTDARQLLGQRVLVHPQGDGKNKPAPIPGVIGSRPPHVLSPAEREKVVGFDDLFVDVGLPARQVERLIQVGDLISFDIQTIKLKGDRVSGKAMDNRVAVAAEVICLETLRQLKHTWDVVAVATVGEETSFLGAKTAAYELRPDAAVAIDVTFAAQHDYSTHVELGKGPVITVGPNYHPKLTQRLIDTCKRLEMDYQVEPDLGGGTDAWPIQVSHDGVPVALIGVPLRYMHSPVETVNVKDVERIGRLMAHFAAGLDDNVFG